MIIKDAINVLKIEAEAILGLINRIDHNFRNMVNLIFNSKGRLIVSGIGKSGIIGRKIVATLNSTGTRALFLHPSEAMHGDLGMVSKDDIFVAFSNSGETDEINTLVPSIRLIGCKIIAFTGNIQSTLASHSDIIINVSVKKEACPLGLAPTASTSALLAMGDALAVSLLNKRHFNMKDFKKNHPGGNLGQRLSWRIKDIMLKGSSIPSISKNQEMESVIDKMDKSRLGTAIIVDTDDRIEGIITDGDLRRLIAKKVSFTGQKAKRFMTTDPKRLGPDSAVYEALNLMEKNQITVLPITDIKGRVLGILHLHDILGKGEFKFNGS